MIKLLRVLAVVAMVASPPLPATTPPTHDVVLPTTPGQVVTVEWTGTSPPGAAGAGNTCPSEGVADPTEDGHRINLSVPAGAYDAVKVRADFHIEWDLDASDLVLSVEKNGVNVGDSDGGTPEENVSLNNPAAGRFDAIACAFAATAPTPIRGRLTLTASSKAPPPDIDGDGVLNEVDVCPGTSAGAAVDADGCPLPTAAGQTPRFKVHPSPTGLGGSAGEPSIGYNKHTKRTMFIALTEALRQTYQENMDPQLLPASCEPLWEDKSGLTTTANSLDPILFTDEVTGRTFNSQLSGANSLFEFTDDDGENWTPGQVGAPNGGADHQTVASGPYPAGQTPPNAIWPATGPKRAVYYCSQSVSNAFCSRSDDGGQTFGGGFPFKNLDCGAGALHGHVKVAPDGTVYVPDSSQCVTPLGETAGHVVAFASADAGKTWAVRDIPQSTGGAASDPSIGIATDGTLYMCYENEDSTVHVAVSRDKGQTWEKDQDIGAPHNIVQTRFPQIVAGDSNRAACAFLGTTTPGNGSSLAFEGVWYGYVATTYDGGDTWHLVNTTPLDPVQGYGGICGSGTCRNLLDFNDLQIDDEGRLLFGYADGCLGNCVTDPSKNGFADKAAIVRQTGGRTLLAAFDNKPLTQYNNPAPLKPAAACVRQDLSTRSQVQSDVVWNAPDTGGSRITNYKVSRATVAGGPFDFIGDAGAKTTFSDTAADPAVEKYYYRVEAINAAGTAPVSNTIELALAALENVCLSPGLTKLIDSPGTGGTAPAGSAGPGMDLKSFSILQPYAADGVIKLVFEIRTDPGTSPQPAGSSWYVSMKTPDNKVRGARMYWSGPSPSFQIYEANPNNAGGVDGRFVNAATIKPADASSKYEPAKGLITIVVKASDLALPNTGDLIGGFNSAMTQTSNPAGTGPAATATVDEMPNGLTHTGNFTLNPNSLCAPNTPPLAELASDIAEGSAPLSVSFTVSGSDADGDTLARYTLDFGDGQKLLNQNFNNQSSVTVTHGYQNPGLYPARLSVMDSRDAVSSNVAGKVITVTAGATPAQPAASGDNNQIGGALSSLSLLVLSLMGVLGLRRRRPR